MPETQTEPTPILQPEESMLSRISKNLEAGQALATPADPTPEPQEEPQTEAPVGETTEPTPEAVAPVTDTPEAPAVDPQAPVVTDEEREYLKSLDDDAAEPEKTPITAEDGKPTPVDYAPYIDKAKKFDDLLADPLIEAVLKAKEAGITDLTEIANHIGIADPKKLSPEQLFELSIKEDGLTEEQYEEAMEDFRSKPAYMQKSMTKAVLKEMEAQRVEKLKSFTPKANQNNQEAQQLVQAAIQKATVRIEDLKSKMVGNKYKGLEITAEMWDQLQPLIGDYAIKRHDANGKLTHFDVDGAVEVAVFKKYGKQLLRATADMAKRAQADEYYRDRHRVAANEIPASAPASTDSLTDASQKLRDKARKNSGRD